MVIGIVAIMLITCTVVVVKVTVIDAKPDMNVSTFKPLTQQKNSNEKYTFVGYIPCNGYVPCKVIQISTLSLFGSKKKSNFQFNSDRSDVTRNG